LGLNWSALDHNERGAGTRSSFDFRYRPEQCPLYPQKRTSVGAIAMSALGHKRTLAEQF
jgi:hypothetical protein